MAGEGQAELTQAYRLFTLALAGAAELPAMNQLREREGLPVAAKWRLAAAYQLAGQPEAARALASGGPPSIQPYRELGYTYGSDLRDRAMVLEAVVLLGLAEHVGPLARSVSESLSRKEWLSTHETAYALLALSIVAAWRLAGRQHEDGTAREGRDPVLLREQLQHVGDDLQEPERPDAVRPPTLLPVREQLALDVDQGGREPHGGAEDASDRDQRLHHRAHDVAILAACALKARVHQILADAFADVLLMRVEAR